MNKGYSGIWMPREILASKSLSPSEKLVLANILNLERCYEANERIADKCGLSVSSVSHAIAKLHEKGFVDVNFIRNNNSKRCMVCSGIDIVPKRQFSTEKGRAKTGAKGDTFPQSCKICKGGLQNLQDVMQNLQYSNRESLAKFATKEKKEKIKKKETAKQKPNIKSFGSHEDFETAFYVWRGGA